MSDASVPYEVRIFRNVRTNESIVNCGKSSISATVHILRATEPGQRVLGARGSGACEFTDWNVDVVKSLPGNADSRERNLAVNEAIASIPSGCLTAINRKAERDVLGTKAATHNVYTSTSASLKLAYTGRTTATASRFEIGLRNRFRDASSRGYELFNAPDLVTRLERSFDDSNDADLFVAECNRRHAEKDTLVGALRTPMKALRAKNSPSAVVKRLMTAGSGAPSEPPSQAQERAPSRAAQTPSLRPVPASGLRSVFAHGGAGQAAASAEGAGQAAASAEGAGQAAASAEGAEEAAASAEGAEEAAASAEGAEGAAASAEGAEGAAAESDMPEDGDELDADSSASGPNIVDFMGIYLFSHPTDQTLKYVAQTPNVRRFVRMHQDRLGRADVAASVLGKILRAQPLTYTPVVLEELSNVKRSYANSRTMHFRRLHGTTGAAARTQQGEFDHKLVAFKHDATKIMYLQMTREPLQDAIQRMHSRVRAYFNRTDKYVRAVPVIVEPDHYVEVLRTFPKTAVTHELSRAKENAVRTFRRDGWRVLNVEEPRPEGRRRYRFYRIFRTVEGDDRCYIGRTTNELPTRIGQHVNEVATRKFSSWHIVADGQFSYEELACKEFDTVSEANAYEAALMDRFPRAINREHASLRGVVVNGN